MSILSKPYFHDEAAAFEYLEGVLWPNGPVCPKCGGSERIYDLTKTKMGRKKCGHCRKQFTVRVGTIFESSHVPLHKWLRAVFLMVSSKKGISSHQLHRVLEVTYKTAWFMAHRIREGMRTGQFDRQLGGEGQVVEVDETFIGIADGETKRRGYQHKQKVLTLVERGGETRSFRVDRVDAKTLVPIIRDHVAKETHVLTDDAGQYRNLDQDFEQHDFVRHTSGEYVCGPIHTNTIEGYFSIFKRGMKGVYQHCGEQHLHRYLAEFDFRYNEREIDDMARATKMLSKTSGKRLYYRQPV